MISLEEGGDKNVAFIRLYNFNGSAPSLFYKAALGSLLQGGRGMILDLRNNSGGYLEAAIDIAGWFLNRGDIVVKEQFRRGEEKALLANGTGAHRSLHAVVLVNSGTASAAEILAGALRDIRGVKLIGEKTFGKGSVQELEILKDGSLVKISNAKWLTPQGSVIHKKGLMPDIEVKMPEKTEEPEKKNGVTEDLQLEKAKEVLRIDMQKTLAKTIKTQ